LVSHVAHVFARLVTTSTNHHIHHQPSIASAAEPHRHPEVFAAAFNSGSVEAVEALFEDLGVLVPEPGRPAAGDDRRAAMSAFLGLGVPIQVAPRHVYVADDVALLIVDWTIEGDAPDGTRVDLRGTATDVARRGVDGRWRYVIDNPFGTA
jgi:ketosteroid isomerase-like protein